MSRRGLHDHLLFIALVPAVLSALLLAGYFLALRLGDLEAAGLPAIAAAEKRQEIVIVTLLAALPVVALAGAIGWRLSRRVLLPARRIEVALEMIRGGNPGIRLPGRGALAELEVAVNALAQALARNRQHAAEDLAGKQQELLRKLELAQAMLDAQARAGVGLAIVEHGRIVFANAATEGMSGYDQLELQAMSHFVQIAHPDDRERIMRNHFKGLAGQDSEDGFDFVLLRRDGELRHVQLVQTSIADGSGQRMLMILLDITERKQAEAQLADTHRQLQSRTEEAERANVAKSRFLVAASHDLRQPLHALALFAAEFETTAATPEQQRLAGQIGAATGAMGELLDALLEVSRLDTADIKPQPQPLALGRLLAGVVEAQRSSAEAKGLAIHCVPTRQWTESDPQLLRRLLGNLVSNAVRYTETGGIVVGVRREGNGLRIEVWDSGIGIEAVQLPLVFQEFYQVANRERDAGKGLGLGLAIVDRIARLLGHRMQVRSTPQRGTVFGVSVPRRAPVETVEPATPPSVPVNAARILVAGGVASGAESLAKLIESWGYHILRAGDEGQLRKHMAAMPDMVVCDDSLFRGLARAVAGRPRRPRVVLMGDAAEAENRAGLVPDARLAKPIKPGRLRALLHHMVEEGAGPAESRTAAPTL
ncbi:MAG TPA: PAS domain-containing sensor histidine kinase [Rhodocyclaceae bacterium]